MLSIRYANASDIDEIRDICLESFELTSLHVDKNIDIHAGQYLFKHYAKKAALKHPSHCFIAERRGDVLGFIIFGVDADMGGRLNIKIGNIILFGVKKSQRNKGIGRALLKHTLNHFKEHSFSLIHVGTDADNLSALNVYEASGFKHILVWATLRYFNPKTSLLTFSEEDMADFEKLNEKNKHVISEFDFIRTHSFFYDKKIDREKAKEKHKDAILKSSNKNELEIYYILHAGEKVGFFSIREDTWLREELEKPAYRLEDLYLVDDYKDNDYLIASVVKRALSLKVFSIFEVWIALSRRGIINACIKEGFYYVHSASVLHLWI